MELRNLRTQKKVRAKELAELIEKDEPMISKFENYKCLPIPKDLRKICEYLDCQINDIYEDDEIYVKFNSKAKEKKELDCYKITIKLPKIARSVLVKDNLKLCGYDNLTHWILCCYSEFKEKLATKKDHPNPEKSNGQIGGI